MYSTIHRRLITPLVEARTGCRYAGEYRKLLRTQYRDRDEIERRKVGALRSLLMHAYENTVFYRERFDTAGFNPADFRSLEELEGIPPLTREDLNGRLDDLTAGNFTPAQLHKDSTGGSSGLPTFFRRDNACLRVKTASENRFNNWSGWRPGELVLRYWPALKDFGAASVKPLVSYLKDKYFWRYHQIYAGKLDEDRLRRHVEEFRRYSPQLVRAFPNALQTFAEFVKAERMRLRVTHGVYTMGEPLSGSQRALFEEVFDCPVFNCYATREAGNIACECREHKGMHVAEELVHVEVVNRRANGVGELLVTDLVNYGMPLIRYAIQDAASEVRGDCGCGRNLARINLESGRLLDHFVSPVNGALVHGDVLLRTLLFGPRVGRVQLIQDRLDHATIRLAESDFSRGDVEAHMRKGMTELFGGRMAVDFEYVDEIPFLPSGKYAFVRRTYKE